MVTGAALFLKSGSRAVRQTGRILIGISLILLSLRLIGDATAPLRDAGAAPAIVEYLQRDFITAFVLGALFTWLVAIRKREDKKKKKKKGYVLLQHVPSPIKLAHNAWVEPRDVIPWVIISAISLIAGTSMGPFFGLVVMGGGLGSWLVTRLKKDDDEEAKQQYTLTGMAGAMGAAFTSPLLRQF